MTPEGVVLDELVDHCVVVTDAWNNRSLVARNSKTKDEPSKALAQASGRYTSAKLHLAKLYKRLLELGCHPDNANRILIDRLPTAVLRDILSELD